ncbi:MAG TPA: LLM class flavin-dependent oxidoreductase [Pararhodobacter sp.]|uniref:LLM class flavin-dependent oxidoreductase n=1 Tax=Pararhodobacter sp. TaxID=2127056 RepID=UPI002BBE818F|nr:LLM class flavin-dependent oxidoreductase [Pararhodobacter sp.]HPD91867.1 LLM class flavin-dependent oxidoreductase [Pararhodobacter sp.]
MTTNKMMQKAGFKLGTFSTNCSSGMTVSKAPERWVNSWENNLTLARMLDDAGIDFMLPIARWIGYGGETDFHGGVLETVTWATALLASTRNLTVFARRSTPRPTTRSWSQSRSRPWIRWATGAPGSTSSRAGTSPNTRPWA